MSCSGGVSTWTGACDLGGHQSLVCGRATQGRVCINDAGSAVAHRCRSQVCKRRLPADPTIDRFGPTIQREPCVGVKCIPTLASNQIVHMTTFGVSDEVTRILRRRWTQRSNGCPQASMSYRPRNSRRRIPGNGRVRPGPKSGQRQAGPTGYAITRTHAKPIRSHSPSRPRRIHHVIRTSGTHR